MLPTAGLLAAYIVFGNPTWLKILAVIVLATIWPAMLIAAARGRSQGRAFADRDGDHGRRDDRTGQPPH